MSQVVHAIRSTVHVVLAKANMSHYSNHRGLSHEVSTTRPTRGPTRLCGTTPMTRRVAGGMLSGASMWFRYDQHML